MNWRMGVVQKTEDGPWKVVKTFEAPTYAAAIDAAFEEAGPEGEVLWVHPVLAK